MVDLRTGRLCVVLAAMLVAAGVAHGQDEPSPDADDAPPAASEPETAPEPSETAPEPSPEPAANAATAAAVAAAPSPDRASGLVNPEDPGRGLLWVPRVLLFVPRLLVEVVDAPIRGGLWAYERYQLADRFKRIFFNTAETAGLFPVAFVETGFGLNAGARFIHRDLFGAEEGMRVRISFGGRFRQLYSLKLDTGKRLGDRFQLEVEGEYESRPKDRFFGIGNLDVGDPAMMPLDPLSADRALKSRFQQNIARTRLIADWNAIGDVWVRGSGAFTHRVFDDSDDASTGEHITENYDVDELTGFNGGLRHTYGELELRYDSRRAVGREPLPQPTTGWLLRAYSGVALGLGDDPSDYLRYGADLQRFIRLGEGPRVLALRVFGEAVTGEYENVPFAELPVLGGPLLLRGHSQDRYRDRALALLSAEYQWDLNTMTAAYCFVDYGRVFASTSDLELSDFNLGYGVGLQMHTTESFLMRVQAASSREGRVFFNLSFDPVYDPSARVERK